MRGIRILTGTLGLTTAMALSAATATAQGGLSIWAGIGGAKEAGVATFAKDVKQLGAQLTIPLVPIAVRADVFTLGTGFDPDDLSYNVNAVVVMPLPLVQPYGIVGKGRYSFTSDLKQTGWNYGGGVRVGVSRMGLFAEMRRHKPLQRTIMTLGVTF